MKAEYVGGTQTIRKFSMTSPAPRPTTGLLAVVVGLVSIALSSRPLAISALLLAGFLELSRRRTVVQESMFVIKNLGVQVTKTQLSGAEHHHFIDCSGIKKLIVNEGLTPYSVFLYVGLVVHGEQELVVPFRNFSLSLEEAKQIYNESNKLLFD